MITILSNGDLEVKRMPFIRPISTAFAEQEWKKAKSDAEPVIHTVHRSDLPFHLVGSGGDVSSENFEEWFRLSNTLFSARSLRVKQSEKEGEENQWIVKERKK